MLTRLENDALNRTELLHCELTLRGLLPLIEGGLELRVFREGEFQGIQQVEHALLTLSGHLMWAQHRSSAPLEEMQGGIHEACECAVVRLRMVLLED